MVSKSKFLAVVLAGLALVSGGRVLAGQQQYTSTSSRQATQPVKTQKGQRQQLTSTAKKGGSIQAQNPVSNPGQCCSPTNAKPGQKQQYTSAPKKGVGYQDQNQTGAKAANVGGLQRPTRPGVRFITNPNQTQNIGQNVPRGQVTSNGQLRAVTNRNQGQNGQLPLQ
jgi:hypothetical protein